MPNILFASNNVSHWPLSISSTLATTFDATRVPYSLKLAYLEGIQSPEFAPAAGTVTWIHFRIWANGRFSNDTGPLLRVFDANNNKLIELDKHQTFGEFEIGLKVYSNGTPTTKDKASIPLNIGTMNSIDMKITVGAASMDGKLYINGGLAATGNFANNDGNYTNPVQFSLHAAFADTDGFQYMSEILVADDDTRNGRLSLLRPIAEGGETDWVGVVAELADDDPTSGMTTILANQRQTLTLGPYTGASNVSSLVVSTQSVAGANAPQNLRHTVRMGAVNYDSVADIPLGAVLEYKMTDFQINPATSIPWVAGDLSTLEIGFISKT